MRKPSHRKDKILITGASGQIGTVLTDALIQQYGEGNVVTSDINPPTTQKTTCRSLPNYSNLSSSRHPLC
jgi:nucleoside-diphosphate-sugar epimerase